MGIQVIGNGGVVAEVDANRNLLVEDIFEPGYPAAGGFYTASGWTVAVVAAGLAASVNLMSARLAVGSTRKAYVTKFRFAITPATLGAAAGVAGTIGLQRFTAQTPTGGTARTAARQNAALGTVADITDIRDSNAALTGTAPTWGDVIGATLVPLFVASAGGFEWIWEPSAPEMLAPGDGIGLRTQFAMAATQTWMYSYTLHWHEK
jgi:hypothetical protein